MLMEKKYNSDFERKFTLIKAVSKKVYYMSV